MSLRAALTAVILCATLLSTEQSVQAQAVSGAINGYVTDSSGAPVPNASVTVVNEETGVKTQMITTADGFYNANNLAPGNYSVSAEQHGFSKLTREHVRVAVDATIRIDLGLSV